VKLIVGLGNPGPQYEKTRHNAGFLVVDRLVRRHASGELPRARFASVCVEALIGPSARASFSQQASPPRESPREKCLLMKPTTYMNRSGQAVSEAARFYQLNVATDILVIVDDLALPAGQIRLRPGGGAGGHNGLSDIQRCIGTPDYPRLRIGIDACPPFMDQADYVLGRFSPEQEAALAPAIDKAADACEVFATAGLAAAMNAFNASEPPRPKPPRPESQPATPNPVSKPIDS
jgi:PTH1 family peptidyl-tRNA hydrolase